MRPRPSSPSVGWVCPRSAPLSTAVCLSRYLSGLISSLETRRQEGEGVQSGDNFHLIAEAAMTRPLIPFWLLHVQIMSRREDFSGGKTSAQEVVSSPLPDGFILMMIKSQRALVEVGFDFCGRQND